MGFKKVRFKKVGVLDVDFCAILDVQDEFLNFEIFWFGNDFGWDPDHKILQFFWRRNFGTRKFGRHEIFMSRPKSSNYDLGLQRPERASNSASGTEIGIQQFVLTVQKKFNFDFEVENRFSAPKFLFRLNFRDFVFAKSKISLWNWVFGSKIVNFAPKSLISWCNHGKLIASQTDRLTDITNFDIWCTKRF